jgi:hypothetical protein
MQKGTHVSDLDENGLALAIHPAEGMAAVAGHEPPADRRSVVGEKHEAGVLALGNVREEVEPRVVVDEEGLRVALLRAASRSVPDNLRVQIR